MAKGKGTGNGGEVRDITVRILQKIHGGIGKLVEGQEKMRGELQAISARLDTIDGRLGTIDGRLANVLDYTLHRYEDHEKRLRSVEDKLAGR